MGIKLDYDVNTVLTPWRVTCQQTNAYEGEADTEIKSIYVIAPDKAAATFWAEEELTSHGDIFDVLAVEPVISDHVHLAYESYQPEGEEYYVLFRGEIKGPFAYEHQAKRYAKGVDKRHNPRVVVHYKENNDDT
jgi:hypothetical protein